MSSGMSGMYYTYREKIDKLIKNYHEPKRRFFWDPLCTMYILDKDVRAKTRAPQGGPGSLFISKLAAASKQFPAVLQCNIVLYVQEVVTRFL